MIALIQRVIQASVTVEAELIDKIERGLLVLLGLRQEDTQSDSKYLAAKTANLRIFSDENDKMNISLFDNGLEVLVVSQFTLHADTRYGNRPSFTDAAEPAKANELYEVFIEELITLLGHEKVRKGIFGAMMKIKLINDGPVTIILKSKNEQ